MNLVYQVAAFHRGNFPSDKQSDKKFTQGNLGWEKLVSSCHLFELSP